MKKIIDYFKCCRVLQILVACIVLIPLVVFAVDLIPAGQITDFSVPPPKETSLVAPEDWGDVIGNPEDGHGANTLAGYLNELREHIHTSSKVYPTLANGVTITGGAAWTLGSFVEIVPINTITNMFDIHYISIENISANDTYELVFYFGNSDTEVGRVRFIKNAVQDGTVNVPMQTMLIPANSKIRAKVASSSGSDNVDISIFYHTY